MGDWSFGLASPSLHNSNFSPTPNLAEEFSAKFFLAELFMTMARACVHPFFFFKFHNTMIRTARKSSPCYCLHIVGRMNVCCLVEMHEHICAIMLSRSTDMLKLV